MIDYKRLDEYFQTLKAEIESAPLEERAALWDKVLDIVHQHAKGARVALDAQVLAARPDFSDGAPS
jgi:hypothetical protein